jgi:hypothetical protein
MGLFMSYNSSLPILYRAPRISGRCYFTDPFPPLLCEGISSSLPFLNAALSILSEVHTCAAAPTQEVYVSLGRSYGTPGP